MESNKWFKSAPQDALEGGIPCGVTLTIHAPHPTRPGCAYTLATVNGFTLEELEKNAQLMISASELLAALYAALFYVPMGTNARIAGEAACNKAEGREKP